MKFQLRALEAELIKNKRSTIFWVTMAAFAVAPMMGGLFMIILQSPDAQTNSGVLVLKAEAMNFSTTWNSYFSILSQAMGVGGILVFGFVASWIFGREFSQGTAKDLLALPISRPKIINAKFIVYILWSMTLAVSNLLIGFFIGLFLLPSPGLEVFGLMPVYFITTLLTILVGFPIACFAIWGKGYLAPLGFVALTLVFAQVIAAAGYGTYFPWSLPGLYSGAGGDYRELLNFWSYLILCITAVCGYLTSIYFWNNRDQTG